MWLLPKGAGGGGGCESCAASRWHSFGRHGMKGVVAALLHVLFSTYEMYSYTVQCHMHNNVPAYLTLAGFPMEVVAAAKVA